MTSPPVTPRYTGRSVYLPINTKWEALDRIGTHLVGEIFQLRVLFVQENQHIIDPKTVSVSTLFVDTNEDIVREKML